MSALQKCSGKSGNVRCGNCSIWVSPVWRYQKTLQMLLCNACSCCYASKGVHRAKPSQEALEKIAEAFEAKQSRNQAALNSGNGLAESESASANSRLMLGKRKRQPRTWGTDVITYQEEDKGNRDIEGTQADRHKVERAEFDMYKRWSDNHYNYNSSDASDDDELSPRMAAEILASMKSAKVEMEREPVNRRPELRRVQPTRDGFSAGIDGVVYLSLGPQPATLKIKKPGKPERSCSKCGATETPTWRKAGGNLDLCNACGVRISAKARSRQHPPLPARVSGNASQKHRLHPAHSLPVTTSEVKPPEAYTLPKASSMPTAKQDSRAVFEQFIAHPAPLQATNQVPQAKPAKDLDYVAAARFSPFHHHSAPRPQTHENYKPPLRSLFQMVQPKQTKTVEEEGLLKQRQLTTALASQNSSFSTLSSNESLLQNAAAYFYSQESLYG